MKLSLQSLIKTLAYQCGYSVKRLRVPKKPEASGRRAALNPRIGDLLHKENPYQGFEYQAFDNDPSGWGSDSKAFTALIDQYKPRDLIIEVGTWKGGSAITMGRALKAAGSPAQILCIDTWLGALEFWNDFEDPTRYGALKLKNGYPSVYYQFLANVCYANLQETIIPFPQTSATAAKWLSMRGITAELIYVDGSHEEEDVYQDLVDYWDVLRGGGVLFGDDYSWDGVRLAVNRFAREWQLEVGFEEDKWVLKRHV